MPWLFALSTQAALVTTAWMGLRLMVSYRAIALGADPATLGLITAVMAVPAFLGALPLGRLSDRLGGALVIIIGLAFMITGTALMIFVPNMIAVILTGTCVSAGQISTTVGQQAFIARLSAPEHRDRDFGTFSAAHSGGQLVGAPLVAFIVQQVQTQPTITVFDTSIGIAATLVCLALAALPQIPLFRLGRSIPKVTSGRTSDSALAIARNGGIWKGLLASGAVLATVDLIYAYVPLWANERGVSVSVVGILLAVRAGVSLTARIGISTLVHRFGRKLLLIAALSVGVIALAILPLVNEWGAFALMVLIGIATGMPQPLTMAWVISITPRKNHGSALGLRMTTNRLAEVIVPSAVAGLSSVLGSAGVFWATAVLLATAVGVTAGSDPDAVIEDEPDSEPDPAPGPDGDLR